VFERPVRSPPSRRKISGRTILIGLEYMPVIIDGDASAASRFFVPFDDRLELHCANTEESFGFLAIGVVRAVELP
jgi:hypothetical protein